MMNAASRETAIHASPVVCTGRHECAGVRAARLVFAACRERQHA